MQATEKIKRYFNQNIYQENVSNLINELLAEEIMKEQNLINETSAYQKLLDFSTENKIKAQKYLANPFSTYVLLKEITGASDKKVLETMKEKKEIFAKEYSSDYRYLTELFNIPQDIQEDMFKELNIIKYNKRMEKSSILHQYFMTLKSTPTRNFEEKEKINIQPARKVLANAQAQDVKNNKELENIKKAIKEKDNNHMLFDELMRNTHPDTCSLYFAYSNIGINDIDLLLLLLHNSASQHIYAYEKIKTNQIKTPVTNYILAERLKVSTEIIDELLNPKTETIVNEIQEINKKYYAQKVEVIQKYLPKKDIEHNNTAENEKKNNENDVELAM